MIKNPKLLRQFEKEKLSYKEALKLFEAMWNEAVAMKILPSKDPLEGLEKDIRIAKILNSCLSK